MHASGDSGCIEFFQLSSISFKNDSAQTVDIPGEIIKGQVKYTEGI